MMSSRKGDEVLRMVQQRKKKYYYERDEVTSPPPPPQQQLTTTTLRTHKKEETKVAVVYYISRNGHLEQPHFMEVPLSSHSDGLHLNDVISRLNVLRGRGLADMYSWSSKRNYKSGYVWQDLSEDDLIQPCNDGQEYVLKGSELPRLNPSGSIRSHNNSTQTNEKRVRKGERSSPPRPASSSSNEGLDGVIVKAGYDHSNNNQGINARDVRNQVLESDRGSGRMKAASSALIHLVMCGPKGVGVVDSIENVPI